MRRSLAQHLPARASRSCYSLRRDPVLVASDPLHLHLRDLHRRHGRQDRGAQRLRSRSSTRTARSCRGGSRDALPAALLQARRGAGLVEDVDRGDGLRARIPSCVEIPPNFQARRAGRPRARAPAQRRRHRHDAGRHRRRPISRAILHSEIASDFASRADGASRARRSTSWCARSSTRTWNSSWFTAVMQIINNVTMLSHHPHRARRVIREREHGTIEHLLVMPVTPVEIMLAKIWANGAGHRAGRRRSRSASWWSGCWRCRSSGSVPLFLRGRRASTCSRSRSLGIAARAPSPARCRSSACWPFRSSSS